MPADLRIHVPLNVKRSLFQAVWFTLRVLKACPLRHSTYLFAAYISMPSLAEATGSGEGEEGKVERTSDLNSSFCTPFTFTDRHRTHTHTLASVPDLTKPSLLRAKVKQMQSSHCYSHNKRVRMNKQRPSGGRNIVEWMRCLGRGQGEVTVTMSEPQARPLVVSSRQQVDRWCNWPETPTRETFWCYLYLQPLLHLLAFSTCFLKGLGSSEAITVSCFIFNCLSFCTQSFLHKHTPVHFLSFCLERSSLSLTGATEVQCLRQQMVAYLTWLRHLPYKIIIVIMRTFDKWNV